MRSQSEPANSDTSGWIELDVAGLDPRDGTAIPFRLVANRFKSSTPDCEAFIHDPLRALIDAKANVEALKPVGPEWRVTTLVVNHHRTLSATHLYAMAAVNTDEQTVGVLLVKKES